MVLLLFWFECSINNWSRNNNNNNYPSRRHKLLYHKQNDNSFVDKVDPKIQNSQVINKIYNDPDFPVSEISAVSSSTGLFSFTVMDSSIAGIASNTIIISGAGTTTIIITQASDNFYNSGISSVTLIINKATPSIHFPNKTVTYGDQDFTIAATSSSTGDFIYTIDDTSIVTHITSSQGSNNFNCINYFKKYK